MGRECMGVSMALRLGAYLGLRRPQPLRAAGSCVPAVPKALSRVPGPCCGLLLLGACRGLPERHCCPPVAPPASLELGRPCPSLSGATGV